MNFKFKKPPFYLYIILWIVALTLGLQLDKKIQNLSDLFGLVVLMMPITFAYIWVLRNKIKIFKYYKKIRKKFKHVFYTIEGLVCVFIFSVIVSLISLGGYKNLKERVLLEYIVWNDDWGACNSVGIGYNGYGELTQYYFKSHTQFLDYFQFKPYSFVKEVYALKDEYLFNFNHCKASRILLKEAHKGNQVAKDMLAAYSTPLWDIYTINDQYIFLRYFNSLDKKKLYNPALEHAHIYKEPYSNDERIKISKEISEQGYLLAMEDYLMDVTRDFDYKINKDQCAFILKYNNHLYQENYLISSASHVFSLMGRTTSGWNKALYECSGKKKDFKRAISELETLVSKLQFTKDTSVFLTTYPAMVYFNGWGNVDMNKELAIQLFKKNSDSKSPSELSRAYLLLNNLNNYKNDLKLLNEILVSEVTIYKPKRYIVCNNVKYDFKIPKVDKENKQQKQSRKLKYLEPLKTCLDNASREQRIESVKSYIKSWIENWFNNPEFVKTLNLYG
jgi:hypothetical protein